MHPKSCCPELFRRLFSIPLQKNNIAQRVMCSWSHPFTHSESRRANVFSSFSKRTAPHHDIYIATKDWEPIGSLERRGCSRGNKLLWKTKRTYLLMFMTPSPLEVLSNVCRRRSAPSIRLFKLSRRSRFSRLRWASLNSEYSCDEKFPFVCSSLIQQN